MSSNFWPKQRASRPNITQNTAISTALTNTSNLLSKFGGETYQIRVWSTLASWLSVGDSSGVTASAGSGVPISANVTGEYFAVTPGQWAAFLSSSTSTGFFSLVEMA